MRRETYFTNVLLATLVGLTLLNPQPARAAVCTEANVRWASSSNSVYLTGPVTCTLAQLDALVSQHAPLDLVDEANQIWLLGANLRMEDGAMLQLYGSDIGGEVNELRLKSNNTADPHNIVFIRADWGTIDIQNTRITSWDESAAGPDTEYTTYGRSFIHVRSRLDADGVTAHESRMDIKNSEIAYLGYAAAESYGLTWKVSGNDQDLFDKVDVHGDVVNSYIHHNYFGAYTYGAYGMNWVGNEVSDNIQYGIDPHDDSDHLVIENNYVHHNGNHGIICSKRCDQLTIRGNTSTLNAGNGIMLHRETNDSLVENNEVTNNADSGIAIFDSYRNTVRNNTATNNGKGIRLSVGSAENFIEGNNFSSNSQYGIYFYQGSDSPTQGDGRPKNNQFVGNAINNNGVYAIKLKEADNNIFDGNDFIGNKNGIYTYSNNPFGNQFVNNYFDGNGHYTIKFNGSVESLVAGNEIKNSTYGVRLEYGSTNNEIRDNLIDGVDKAIYLKAGSHNNTFISNTLQNGDYPVHLYDSSDSTFTGNILANNDHNYYYVKQNSENNEIIDTAVAPVKIGDDLSQVTIISTASKTIENDKNIPTTFYPDHSEIIFTRAISGSVVTFVID